MPTDTGYLTVYVVVGASWLVGLCCLVHLWLRPCTVVRRLLWSPVLFVPLLGPALYGALFVPPKPNEEGEKAPMNRDA